MMYMYDATTTYFFYHGSFAYSVEYVYSLKYFAIYYSNIVLDHVHNAHQKFTPEQF